MNTTKWEITVKANMRSFESRRKMFHIFTGVSIVATAFLLSLDFPSTASPKITQPDTNIDNGIFTFVDRLRKTNSDISWLEGELVTREIPNRPTRRKFPDKITDLKNKPALQAACLAGDFIAITIPEHFISRLDGVVRPARCKLDNIAGTTYAIYPTAFDDPITREIMLVEATLKRATNSIAERLRIINYVSAAKTNADALLLSWGTSAAPMLAQLQSQANITQVEFDQESNSTVALTQSLKDWGTKIAELTSPRDNIAAMSTPKSHYNPNQDPGISIVKGDPHIVPIDTSKVPSSPWDGANGVAIPYIDRDLESALEKFFAQEHAALVAAGLGDLKLEGAIRTPERQASLSSDLKVGPYDSNHLIGTAVDFTSQVNWKAKNLTAAQIAERHKAFDTVQGLLSKHGIVLGTYSNGKYDPVHATLKGFDKPTSSQRLERTVSMVARYAAGYSRLHAIALAQKAAADSRTSEIESRLARTEAEVKAASDKCQKIQTQLGQQRSKNQELAREINECVQTYGMLKALKDHDVAPDVDGQDLANSIDQGDDVSDQIQRAYNAATQRCEQEFGSYESSITYNPDGTISSFNVSCGDNNNGNSGDDGYPGDDGNDTDGGVIP